MYICIAFLVFESVILLNKFGSFMDGTVDGSEIHLTSWGRLGSLSTTIYMGFSTTQFPVVGIFGCLNHQQYGFF